MLQAGYLCTVHDVNIWRYRIRNNWRSHNIYDLSLYKLNMNVVK